MSLFSWFSSPPVSVKEDSSGLIRDERTRPTLGGRGKTAVAMPPVSTPSAGASTMGDRPSERKSHRHAKRELLYVAVREAMIRAGVLSASYKFKVLSLDPRGEQFMVMMDLAQDFGDQMERLTEIEVMIAQSAKQRYNIRVTAVYWRMNEVVSVARPVAAAPAGSGPRPVFSESDAQVHSIVSTGHEAATTQSPARSRYEPIHADEVTAFKQAVAAAATMGAVSPDKESVAKEKETSKRSIARSYTLLTGFEDTELPDFPAAVPALSATQYGDLN